MDPIPEVVEKVIFLGSVALVVIAIPGPATNSTVSSATATRES